MPRRRSEEGAVIGNTPSTYEHQEYHEQVTHRRAGENTKLSMASSIPMNGVGFKYATTTLHQVSTLTLCHTALLHTSAATRTRKSDMQAGKTRNARKHQQTRLPHPALLEADVKWVVELGLIVGSHVQSNREAVRRMHPRTCSVQSKLANLRNTHICT